MEEIEDRFVRMFIAVAMRIIGLGIVACAVVVALLCSLGYGLVLVFWLLALGPQAGWRFLRHLWTSKF